MNKSEGIVNYQVEKGKMTEFQNKETFPEINPFLVEPVLVKLLKLVESVSQLKELRLMCQTWDEFNLKEIEDRAFNGKLKAINLYWSFKKFHTNSVAEAKLIQFMEDTTAIPQLFTSFKFNFPESWTILSEHMEFFSIYPVTFVHLTIQRYLCQQEIEILLIKFMGSETWSNFKEITVSTNSLRGFGFPDSSLFDPGSGNIPMKLQKLDIKSDSPSILKIFESAFASGKYTNLTSIGLFQLPSGNVNFPGLDPSKLTRLQIKKIGDMSPPALEFTSGLINMARNGMALKRFGMNINLTPNQNLELEMDRFFFDNLAIICSSLTQFLASQSSTLETLNFAFSCHLKDPVEMPEGADIWAKIHLPKFEALQTLKLLVDFELIETNPRRIHKKLFGMTQNLAVTFPKLVNLTLNRESSLIALKVNPAQDEAGQLHLKRLEILDNAYDPIGNAIWGTSFEGIIGSVEDLACPAKLLCGERLPWGESLRSLYIYDINKDIEIGFKLNHFKKLERLVTKYYGINERRIQAGNYPRPWYRKVEDYLNIFKEATELPLTSIKFIGPKMEKNLKQEFINFFPFPVEFKKKLL